MRKLFVTDLDGTLVHHNKMTEGNYNALKRLKDKKYFVTVATGRPYNGAVFLKKDYNIEIDYFVLLNGALIMDGEGNVIDHKTIPYGIIKQIVESFEKFPWEISIETGFDTFVVHGAGEILKSVQKVTETHLEELKDKKLSLISIYGGDLEINDIEKACDDINKKYGKYVVAYRNTNFIDVVPVGCSKGEGVNHVKETLGVDKKEVYAIGDSWNDISMFKVSGKSFTFHNVEKNLKVHASYLVDSVEECVDKYIIKNKKCV